MIDRVGYRTIDSTLFTIANLVNLLIMGIMVSRPKGLARLEYALGIVIVAMIVPVGIALILNIVGKREWWAIALPLLLISFFVVSLAFDHILKLDWRNTALLWPYITIYYLASIGMIGYSFSIDKPYGFITLTTYFLALFAAWYAHSR